MWSHNRDVGTEQIEEPSNADLLASLRSEWNFSRVASVPQLFIDVYLPRLRLAEVKLFLYFCRHIPVPSESTTPAGMSMTISEMADRVGLSRDMAMKALRVLEQEKLIICDRPHGRRTNQYWIRWGTFRWRPETSPT